MAVGGAYGPIVFQGGLGTANTFHSISKVRKENFVKHRTIQSLDILESTGEDLIEVNVEMHFHGPYTLAPSAAIAALEAVQAMKIPLPLIIGRVPVGRGLLTLFVVEAIDSKMSRFVGPGLAVADITVKLVEYGNPFGTLGPLSALGGMLPGLSGFIGTVNNVATLASAAGTIPGLSQIAGRVTGALAGVSNVVSTVTGGIAGVSNVLSSVTGGITAISNVSTSIQAAARALSPGGISGVITATAGQVQGALSSLQALGKASPATKPLV